MEILTIGFNEIEIVLFDNYFPRYKTLKALPVKDFRDGVQMGYRNK